MILGNKLRSFLSMLGVLIGVACVITMLVMRSPSEDSLNRQTVALVAREESNQLTDLLGLADDLSLLTPVVDKKSSIVEVLTTPGS